MKNEHHKEKIKRMLNKMADMDQIVTVKLKEFLFGTTRPKSLTEPAKLERTILRSVYPEDWNPVDTDLYNDWCETNKVSSVYHIKQTNNIKWK